MIYGYLRVSTDMQDKNSQKQGVDEFAAKKGSFAMMSSMLFIDSMVRKKPRNQKDRLT